ncbi:MAG: phage regulatory protein/antirepressor Ant [Muribaculum sp.]|nr:phage regulatory protein/antirepressor Ant [Muribaculum sp.]
MKDLKIFNTDKEQTMTSLQVAEITGKQHAHIMRDIRNLLEQGVNASNFGLVEYKDSKGEARPCYELTKKGCLILASGYNALLREKIINRWIELETAVKLNVPQTYSQALLLAAKQAEQIEEQQRLLIAQSAVITEQTEAISQMQPKVDYCDIILKSPSTVLVKQIAQDYGMTANKLNKTLADMKIQYKRGKQWILYGKYVSKRYVQSTTEPYNNSKNGYTYTLTKWTQKGRIFLYNELKSRGILPLIEQSPF